MQVEVDIAFEQLVQIARKLSDGEWQKLKWEVESEKKLKDDKDDLLEFLLKGPTFTKEQIDTIEENRKAINRWRTIS
jgi:hypothetical protein